MSFSLCAKEAELLNEATEKCREKAKAKKKY
jgi:hypothetical protein